MEPKPTKGSAMDEIETTKVKRFESLKPAGVKAAKFLGTMAAAALMSVLMDKAVTGVTKQFSKPKLEG